MDVHKKKYFILLTPALIFGIFLAYYLPAEDKLYMLSIPIVFWIIYYSWIYVEKKNKGKEQNINLFF